MRRSAPLGSSETAKSVGEAPLFEFTELPLRTHASAVHGNVLTVTPPPSPPSPALGGASGDAASDALPPVRSPSDGNKQLTTNAVANTPRATHARRRGHVTPCS